MKVYEYKLRPTRKQEQRLWELLKSSRELYNRGLQELLDHYAQTGKHLNRFRHDKSHNKTTDPSIPAVVIDTTLDRLHRSFENFFSGVRKGERVGFPRFKSANRWHSIQYRDATHRIKDGRFSADRTVGSIRIVKDRPIEGAFKRAAIIRRPSGWYLQCACESVPKLLPPTGKYVGLDVGLTHLVADSDGRTWKNHRSFQKSMSKLAKAQREMARKTKGSHRRRKAARKVARIHEHIANQRRDCLHKISRYYVNSYDMIAVEDLRIKNMVRNHCLSRGILDASWGMLDNMLAYKAEEAGRRFIKVPPQWTSQKCSRCGRMVMKALSVRTHVCECGYVDDRDVNAAKNILQIAKAGTPPSRRDGEGEAHCASRSPVPLMREPAGL